MNEEKFMKKLNSYDYTFYMMEHWESDTGAYWEEETGLEIDLDGNDQVLSWSGYGDYWNVGNIKTLNGLYDFIKSHINEIEEPKEECKYTRLELIEELLEFITETRGFKDGVNELEQVSAYVL